MIATSRRQAISIGTVRYNTGKKCRKGHYSYRLTSTGQCCQCKNEYQSNLRKTNPELVSKKERGYYERNRQSRIDYRKAHYEKIKHTDEFRQKANMYTRIRQKRLRTAAILGITEEIKKFYNECPPGMEVDHIIPLNNPHVCGLHVHWNLQYLTPDENRKKSNHFSHGKIHHLSCSSRPIA